MMKSWENDLGTYERYYSIDFALYNNSVYYVTQSSHNNLVNFYKYYTGDLEFSFDSKEPLTKIFRADDRITI